jgi:2-dehydropantoate 2-reductase
MGIERDNPVGGNESAPADEGRESPDVMNWIDRYRSRQETEESPPRRRKKREEPEKHDKPKTTVREAPKKAQAGGADSRTVLLIGAGAVGSYLASKLILAGHEVVVVDRPERADFVLALGFHLQEGETLRSARPVAAAGSLAEASPLGVEYDLAILATKAYDAQAALEELAAARMPRPRKVMTVQNGVETEETAARAWGADRVLAASLTAPITVKGQGQVAVERGGRGLALAPVVKGEPVDEWVALFRDAGLKTRGYGDYRAIKWSKLFLNIIANASCAILNRRPAVIYRYRPTFMLEREMLRETLAVMRRLKVRVVNLPGGPARTLAWVVRRLPADLAQGLLQPMVGSGRGDKLPSLYLDLAAGRKQTEVVHLNGAVVRHGRGVNVPTPVNYVLTDTLHKLVRRSLLWDDFGGKPDALLARLRTLQQEEG